MPDSIDTEKISLSRREFIAGGAATAAAAYLAGKLLAPESPSYVAPKLATDTDLTRAGLEIKPCSAKLESPSDWHSSLGGPTLEELHDARGPAGYKVVLPPDFMTGTNQLYLEASDGNTPISTADFGTNWFRRHFVGASMRDRKLLNPTFYLLNGRYWEFDPRLRRPNIIPSQSDLGRTVRLTILAQNGIMRVNPGGELYCESETVRSLIAELKPPAKG
jgi:hypothetical protein